MLCVPVLSFYSIISGRAMSHIFIAMIPEISTKTSK